MKSKNIVEKYKSILIKIIHKYAPNCKIYLFGSRARKKHRAGSDIDLAIESENPIDLFTIAKMKEEIDEKTSFPLCIDIVDLSSSDKDFKNEVKRDGILWTD